MFQYVASVLRTKTEHEMLNHSTHWTCINPFLARTFTVRPATPDDGTLIHIWLSFSACYFRYRGFLS